MRLRGGLSLEKAVFCDTAGRLHHHSVRVVAGSKQPMVFCEFSTRMKKLPHAL
jgi:hypothetical protein